MFDEPWPETVAGWEFTRSGTLERYRRQLANGVTVGARWDVARRRGTVTAYVQPAGTGRTLTTSRAEFESQEAMWTAARLVLDVAANLPSFRTGDESPAESVLRGEVAGDVEVKPGCGDEPEAELTFTLTDGRSVTLVMSEEQTDAMSSGIHSLRKHVWSEYDHLDDEECEEDEEDSFGHAREPVEVPDVSEADSSPDTGHDVITVLASRFGVTDEHLVATVDWRSVIVVGEPAVTALCERADELAEALAPRWWPGVLERPGENWVVLNRA